MPYELGVYKPGDNGSEKARDLLEVAQPEGEAEPQPRMVRLLILSESFCYPMLALVPCSAPSPFSSPRHSSQKLIIMMIKHSEHFLGVRCGSEDATLINHSKTYEVGFATSRWLQIQPSSH